MNLFQMPNPIREDLKEKWWHIIFIDSLGYLFYKLIFLYIYFKVNNNIRHKLNKTDSKIFHTKD